NADQYYAGESGDQPLPLQLLTIENLTFAPSQGDSIIVSLSRGDMDWSFNTVAGYNNIAINNPVHLSVGSLEDNNTHYVNSSLINDSDTNPLNDSGPLNTLWRKFNRGVPTMNTYNDYVASSSMFGNSNPIILRSGLVRSHNIFDYDHLTYAYDTFSVESIALPDEYLGQSSEQDHLGGSFRDPRLRSGKFADNNWNIYNVEAVPRSYSNHSYNIGKICNEYYGDFATGTWNLCSPSSDLTISSDFFHDSGSIGTYQGEFTTDIALWDVNDLDDRDYWTNNGASSGGLQAFVGYSTLGTEIQSVNAIDSAPRSRQYTTAMTKNIVFTTGLYSHPERLADYQG
ncbi:hypothetical protein LCGC14_3125000, partial [marine sediment metagenome]